MDRIYNEQLSEQLYQPLMKEFNLSPEAINKPDPWWTYNLDDPEIRRALAKSIRHFAGGGPVQRLQGGGAVAPAAPIYYAPTAGYLVPGRGFVWKPEDVRAYGYDPDNSTRVVPTYEETQARAAADPRLVGSAANLAGYGITRTGPGPTAEGYRESIATHHPGDVELAGLTPKEIEWLWRVQGMHPDQWKPTDYSDAALRAKNIDPAHWEEMRRLSSFTPETNRWMIDQARSLAQVDSPHPSPQAFNDPRDREQWLAERLGGLSSSWDALMTRRNQALTNTGPWAPVPPGAPPSGGGGGLPPPGGGGGLPGPGGPGAPGAPPGAAPWPPAPPPANQGPWPGDYAQPGPWDNPMTWPAPTWANLPGQNYIGGLDDPYRLPVSGPGNLQAPTGWGPLVKGQPNFPIRPTLEDTRPIGDPRNPVGWPQPQQKPPFQSLDDLIAQNWGAPRR